MTATRTDFSIRANAQLFRSQTQSTLWDVVSGGNTMVGTYPSEIAAQVIADSLNLDPWALQRIPTSTYRAS
jgi:hypothetical protein